MKIVQKMTLAFLLGTCAILALNGALRVRREVALFESNAVQDHRSLARTLRSVVEGVWNVEGEARALQLVDDAEVQHGRVHFRWLWLDASPQLQVDPKALAAVDRGGALSVIGADDDGERRRYTYMRVTTPNGRPAALELSESLATQESYVRTTVRDTIFTTLALVAVSGILALFLGTMVVGRPVRALVAKARRIGAGDLGGPLAALRPDELGELALEMNTMCDRLGEAQVSLEAETARRLTALEQLRHADRLSTVDKLASRIAHELGTPLNVVAARAAMVVSREVEGDEAVDCARVIVDATERMTGIIRQLLDFARRRGPERESADLAVVARQTLALLRTIASKKRIELSLRSDGPIVADVDTGQMQQVLTNLVINAIQASPAGSAVSIEVKREVVTPPPDVGTGEATYAVVRVRDEGPGISPDDLAHVFEPFFTTKGVGEGTGLGLSVAYGLVRDHGGFLDAQSEEGKGATFAFYVPVDVADGGKGGKVGPGGSA